MEDIPGKKERAFPETKQEDGKTRTSEYVSVEGMLTADNARMRRAGCKLAAAALKVAHEYDGIHRLMLAVAEWSNAVADEGGRYQRYIRSEGKSSRKEPVNNETGESPCSASWFENGTEYRVRDAWIEARNDLNPDWVVVDTLATKQGRCQIGGTDGAESIVGEQEDLLNSPEDSSTP